MTKNFLWLERVLNENINIFGVFEASCYNDKAYVCKGAHWKVIIFQVLALFQGKKRQL